MMSEPEQVANILKKVIGDLSSEEGSFETQLVAEWEKMLVPEARKHSRLLKVENKALFILVDHPSWYDEFQMKYQSQILQQIQETFGKEKIKRIIIKVGKI